MSERSQVDPITSEHLLEVRFKPNPRVLDLRGAWVQEIADQMDMREWGIVENRLDVFDSDEKRRAFVSFQNFGFLARDCPTTNYFPDHANKFLRIVTRLEEFGANLWVARIGMRARFCTPYDGTFDQLRARFLQRYVGLSESALDAIGREAKVLDIGAHLNFVDQYGNFNTMCGPMVRAQIDSLFPKVGGFPDVGLYYDIDYWLKPERELDTRELPSQVTKFSSQAWQRHERICRLILEG